MLEPITNRFEFDEFDATDLDAKPVCCWNCGSTDLVDGNGHMGEEIMICLECNETVWEGEG